MTSSATQHVAVLGRTIAKTTGTAVGDTVRLATANGPADFRVIGISANQADNGSVVFVPVSALQSVLGDGRLGQQLLSHHDDERPRAHRPMSITVLGLLIVAISMVAPINAITIGVLERTREIGCAREAAAGVRAARRRPLQPHPSRSAMTEGDLT